MSYREKSIIVTIISTIIIFGWFCLKLNEMNVTGVFDGADASQIMGKSILKFIGISIGISIAVQIVFAILHGMVTRDGQYEKEDERDKLIEMKGMQMLLVLFSFGFIGSLIALAMGTAAHVIFFLLIASMFVGNLFSDCIKLFFYRRGF